MRMIRSTLIATAVFSLVACAGDEAEMKEVTANSAESVQKQAYDAANNINDMQGASGLDSMANAAETSAWEKLFVTGTPNLRVRNAPSIDAPVVRTIESGTEVMNTGFERTWIKIAEGEWASAKHLQNSNGTLALEYIMKQNEAITNTPTGPMKVVGTELLRVRTAPNVEATVARTIEQGTVIEGQATLPGGWIKIGEGEFIHKSYLSPANTAH